MTNTNQNKAQSITGRDDMIINKALAYAILTIENLPRERQEQSDCDDMRALLVARTSSAAHRDHVMQGARAHIGLDDEPFFVGRQVGHLTVIK